MVEFILFSFEILLTFLFFIIASSFFDILEQFGDIDEEITSKNKYSKWKATEIMKALKEGRTPEPGGYGEVNFSLKFNC